MNHRILIWCLLVTGLALPAGAQVSKHGPDESVVAVEYQTRIEAVVESKVTSGRPYSAEATTEFVQILGDGNRISRRTTVRVFRDGEGRTRREVLGADGTPVSVSIYDPVGHVSYVLNPATRSAQKSAVRVVFPEPIEMGKVRAARRAAERIAGKIALVAPGEVPPEAASVALQKQEQEMVAYAAGAAGASAVLHVSTVDGHHAPTPLTTESLGQKFIDGVAAEGTKRQFEIPAGTIGNQQPIVVVSEEWFSPDLEIFVMTRHSDPRSGDTTYSLSNIVRAEPAPALFEVPSDYTIRDSSYMREPAIH